MRREERRRIRSRIKVKQMNKSGFPRLVVFRSGKNIYAQLVSINGEVLLCSSTIDKDFPEDIKGYNLEGAKTVGDRIGKKIKEKGISKIVFDRSGYLYHGRIKILADKAREYVEF